MSERTFNETFGKIYQILINDNLTASENIAILTKLLNTILERSGVSEQALLRAVSYTHLTLPTIYSV